MRGATVGVRHGGWLVFGVFFVSCGGKTIDGAGNDGGDPDSTSATSSASTMSSSTSGTTTTTGGDSDFTSDCLAFCEQLDCSGVDIGDCRDGCRSADPGCESEYRDGFACFNRVFDASQPCEDALLEVALTCQNSFESIDDCEGADEIGPTPSTGAPPPECSVAGTIESDGCEYVEYCPGGWQRATCKLEAAGRYACDCDRASGVTGKLILEAGLDTVCQTALNFCP